MIDCLTLINHNHLLRFTVRAAFPKAIVFGTTKQVSSVHAATSSPGYKITGSDRSDKGVVGGGWFRQRFRYEEKQDQSAERADHSEREEKASIAQRADEHAGNGRAYRRAED
jgi:hypothetical protein